MYNAKEGTVIYGNAAFFSSGEDIFALPERYGTKSHLEWISHELASLSTHSLVEEPIRFRLGRCLRITFIGIDSS